MNKEVNKLLSRFVSQGWSINNYLKECDFEDYVKCLLNERNPRIGALAPIYLTAVLKYLTFEVLELAGNIAREEKENRIEPRHIQLAIRSDDELNQFWMV